MLYNVHEQVACKEEPVVGLCDHVTTRHMTITDNKYRDREG